MGKQVWTYNGLSLSKWGKWDVEEVLEGIGIPKYRGDNLQIPFQHGNRWMKKRFDRRKVVLSMWIRGTSRSDLDSNIELFLKGIGRSGLHTLSRTMRSGEIRETQAEIASEINFVIKNPSYAKFALEFEIPETFFYGTKKEIVSKTISLAETSWTVTNDGTAPITDMIITLEGPLGSPRIENTASDIWVQYQGVIATGETVVMNTNDFTCLKGTENHISGIKHGGDAYWMTLEPGENSLEITVQDTGGSITIEYYPAYF